MQFLPRLLQKQIESHLFHGKIVILYGPRQVGKTTLVKQILYKYPQNSHYFHGEILAIKQGLETTELEQLKKFLGGYKLVVLDEVQKIKDIGLVLKIIADNLPQVQIIATGSSSFDLAGKVAEPLTGRANRFLLYPFSWEEIKHNNDLFTAKAKLESILRFGSYPEVFLSSEDKAKEMLEEITANYLYKDILAFEGLKKSSLIVNLLQLLALQIGQEVSYQELAKNLGVSRLTVQKYLDLLEQTFVIFTLRAFSRNLRKEIAKSVKIYFYDLGVRNSLIQNYNPLAIRSDSGALWENFLMMERIKKCSYHKIYANHYFWRTYDKKEIDYVEEREGKLFAYEFKWGRVPAKQPREFLQTYDNAQFEVINRENYDDFIG